MKFTKHIQQGQLLYFTQNDECITINENEHCRWIAFDNVVQSMMLKRKPWQLTLPHQFTLLLPLIFFKPKHIVEFGLGGGNSARFLLHYLPEITFDSIEYSASVIECFQRYFNPNFQSVNLHHSSALDWLFHHKKKQVDWFITDIYHTGQHINDALLLTKNILKNIDEKAILSINLPCPSNEEIGQFLDTIRKLSANKEIVYFHVPRYLNVVIHILPVKLTLVSQQHNPAGAQLPSRILNRWQRYWHQGYHHIP